MTRNPYAHPDEAYEGPARTSKLAIASLVVSILAIVACCIPGPGILGTLLGVFALMAISRAGGELGGRGMAIAGVVVGLFATALAVGVWVVIAQFYAGVAQPVDRIMSAVEQRDHQTVRGYLSPPTSAAVTDEQLDAFADAIQAELGAYRGTTQGGLNIIQAWAELTTAITAAQRAGAGQSSLPVPVEFDAERAVVFLELDRAAGTSPTAMGLVSNIIVGTKASRLIALVPLSAPGTPPAPPPAPPGTPPADPGGPDPDRGGDEGGGG